ncbi:MAG: CoA pyrophosphatase [Candidatus Sedimenticola sp. (ex Thyasira tokunagai)]
MAASTVKGRCAMRYCCEIIVSMELNSDRLYRLIAGGGLHRLEADSYPEGFFPGPPSPAAVLMPLFRADGAWHLLFIRRSEHENDHHSGQVAFPGGKVDGGDIDAVDTALREAREEIGLDSSHITLLGHLDQYRTISNYLVKPVVAEIPWPLVLVPDKREVSRIFSIPLNWLADGANYQVNHRVIEGTELPMKVIRFEPYDGEVLWGVSARLTINLLQILGLVALDVTSQQNQVSGG